MRGESSKQTSMVVLRSPEDLVPKDHPIRRVKALADAALKEMSPRFDAMYAEGGRDSVPPEALLKASLLIALYSVRSERMFCEQLAYNMLYRWFLDMDMVQEPFNHSTFSKNFRGEQRRNDTHESKTDPEATLRASPGAGRAKTRFVSSAVCAPGSTAGHDRRQLHRLRYLRRHVSESCFSYAPCAGR